MNRAKEYRDPETGGLYYDHTTIYKKEKKMKGDTYEHTVEITQQVLDLFDALKEEAGAQKEKIGDLEEKVKLNNKRINHSVDTNTELWNELAKLKRLVLENKDDWQGTTLSADKNKK